MDDVDFGDWDNQPLDVFGRQQFHHVEHAKWSVFFDHLGIDYELYPQNKRIIERVIEPWTRCEGMFSTGQWQHSFEASIQPTFELNSCVWFCKARLTGFMQVAAYRIARELGKLCVICDGQIFQPTRGKVPTVWATKGLNNCSYLRCWGKQRERHVLLDPKTTTERQLFAPRILNSYSFAMAFNTRPLSTCLPALGHPTTEART